MKKKKGVNKLDMDDKERQYLQSKISRRLSCIKVQIDYQLEYYNKNKTLYYDFNGAMSYVKEYMNDIQIIQDKLKGGF